MNLCSGPVDGICRSGGNPRAPGRAKPMITTVMEVLHTWTSLQGPVHEKKEQEGKAEDAGEVFTGLTVQQTHLKGICFQPAESPLENA